MTSRTDYDQMVAAQLQNQFQTLQNQQTLQPVKQTLPGLLGQAEQTEKVVGELIGALLGHVYRISDALQYPASPQANGQTDQSKGQPLDPIEAVAQPIRRTAANAQMRIPEALKRLEYITSRLGIDDGKTVAVGQIDPFSRAAGGGGYVSDIRAQTLNQNRD